MLEIYFYLYTGLFFLQMVEILFHYADRALKKCPDQGKIQVMEQHFQVCLYRCFEEASQLMGQMHPVYVT